MTKREFYFDNAKFILIFFVVFGHLLQSYIGSSSFISSLYKFIYTFHMPAFILISGFFAKGIYEKGYASKLVKKLILPYIVFQLIYSVFYYFLHSHETYSVNLLNPYWSLWFLISLFCWNLMVIAFNKWRPVYALSLAFAIGLAVGYVDWISNTLSLSRTFVFFPFFLIGFYLDKKHFHAITSVKAKWLAVCVMAFVAVGVYHFPDLNEKWLLGSKPYSVFGTDSIMGIFSRSGVYILSLFMIACFFAFVPKRQLFFTKWGKNTLYVYLLHGFIVRAFRGSELESYLNNQQAIIILFVATCFLTSLLSSSITTTMTQPIIELKWSRLRQLFQNLRSPYGQSRGNMGNF